MMQSVSFRSNPLVVVDLPRKKHRNASTGIFKYVETVQGDDQFLDITRRSELEMRMASYSMESSCAEDDESLAPSKASTGANHHVPIPRFTMMRSSIFDSDEQLGSNRGSPCHPQSSMPDSRSPASSLALYDGMHGIPQTPAPDPQMEQFDRMVQQYLTVNNIFADRASDDAPTATTISRAQGDIHDEYVYDLFLFRRQDVVPQMDFDTASVGLVSLGPEDQIEFGSPSDDEAESDDLYDDDVDSNAEDNPINDYPDESDSFGSSTEDFHVSEHDDV